MTMQWRVIILTLLLLSPCAVLADSRDYEVQARGLLKGSAILVINGKQRLLKVGQRSPEGVLLVEADAKQAVIEIAGERRQLTLSRRISGNFSPVSKPKVAIRRTQYNQYISSANINGKRLQVLVDTGANLVAMSGRDANRLNIDYQQGIPVMVRTASGEVPSYQVTLRSVDVGGIQVRGIQAVVIEGEYPETVLLGMSFLQHVDMNEQNGILYLQGKY